jgi:hypothetical protein
VHLRGRLCLLKFWRARETMSNEGSISELEIPQMQPSCSADTQPKSFLALDSLDGRMRGPRRARQVVAELVAELGGNLSARQVADIERAATLAAVAEDARARRLAGDLSVGLNDLVRVDNLADRALRQVRALKPAQPKFSTRDLQSYLTRTHGTKA